ncbi:MAG: hypothetical protein JWN20_1979 [Jatrophihabitantaceae bacterium]|nr:hypothetical protein [Jatrophihabitantaceae bacterium]
MIRVKRPPTARRKWRRGVIPLALLATGMLVVSACGGSSSSGSGDGSGSAPAGSSGNATL